MLENAPIMAVLPCVNLEAARKFYSETLGLKPADMEIPEEAEALAYQGGQGTGLFIYRRETPTRADHTAVGFMVADLEAVVDELASRGVSLERYDIPGMETDERGITSDGRNKTAWIKDPEGNILSLNEYNM